MKKILLSLSMMIAVSGCSKGFEVKVDSRPTDSANRVVSIHENLTYTNNGVVVTDEVDPALHFTYESKIAAPASVKNTYAGLIQATAVAMISPTKMVIAYNTKTAVVEGGVDIVDITNLQAPVILYSYVISNMEFADAKVVGTKLYLSGAKENTGSLLVTMDLSNLAAPTVVDTKLISSYYATSISTKGTNLLVTTGDTGDVYSYTLNGSGIPQENSHEPHSNLLFTQHYADGYVVLFDDAGKTKLGYRNTVANTFNSMVLRNVHFESPARFDIHGSVAYVSTADEQVIEQVDLLTLTKIHTITTTGRGNGLRYDNGFLYSASGEEGFKLFDVRDQFNPIYKGYFNFNDQPSANNIWTFDLTTKKVIVLADGLGGVKIISQDLTTLPHNYCTYATAVVSYSPAGTIDASRKVSSNVLGAPTGDIENVVNFATLGKTGSIIVSFDVPIKNVSGPDLRVYEVSWDGKTYAQYPEQAEVYGSNDLVTWTDLGVVKNDNGNPALGQVDLGSMTQAKYIKLVDTTTSSVSPDGFDVEAFACLNQENAPICDGSINLLKNGSFDLTSSDVGLVQGYALSAVAASPAGWDVFQQIPFWQNDLIGTGTTCAQEHGTCTFTGSAMVKYVSNGDPNKFVTKLVTGPVACENSVFTDPDYGTLKHCEIGAFGGGIEVQRSGVSGVNPYDGALMIELDSHPTAISSNSNSKVSQSINLGTGNYTLSFQYKARIQSGNTSELKVLLDDVVVATVNDITSTTWSLKSVTLNNVSAGNHKISFMGSGTQDQLGALVDAASLKQICLP